MKKVILIGTILIFLAGRTVAASRSITIFGRVIDELSGLPLEGVSVTAVQTGQAAASSFNGDYILVISSGSYDIAYEKKDFKKFTKKVSMKYGRQKIDVSLLNVTVLVGEEVVVTAKEPVYTRPSVSKETFTKEEIKKISGPKEDIFDAVKLLAGVAATSEYTAEFAVRGGDPDETGVFLDNTRVASPYHLETGQDISGGLITVFNNDMIEKVTLYAGGYPARFGDAMSGVLEIETKDADKQKRGGNLNVSLIDSRVYYNLPVNGNLGIMMAARRTYFDLLLNAFMEKSENSLAVFVFPSFWDMHLKMDYNVSEKDRISFYCLPSGNLAEIDMAGSMKFPDGTGLFAGKETDYEINYKWDTKSALAYLDWNHRFSGKLDLVTTLAHNGKKWDTLTGIALTEPGMNMDTYEKISVSDISLGTELVYYPSQKHDIRCGFRYGCGDVRVDVNVVQDSSMTYDGAADHYDFFFQYTTSVYTLSSYSLDVYLQDRYRIADRLYLDVGLRFDYFDGNGDWNVSPRFGISCGLTDRVTGRAAWGYYYQTPSMVDFLPEWGGNEDLKAMRAEHRIVSLESELPYNTTVKLEGYIKDYTGLVCSDFAEVINADQKIYGKVNGGTGSASGTELTLKNSMSEKFSCWVAYTLSRSRKREYNDTSFRYFDYDRRHILTTYFNFQPKRRINAGVTWKFFSGRPYTPLTRGVKTGAIWEADEGAKNSARTPAYNRVDLRVSRDYMYRKWQATLYMEIINLLGTKNVAGYSWNPVEGEQVPSYSLPFIPFVGFEARF